MYATELFLILSGWNPASRKVSRKILTIGVNDITHLTTGRRWFDLQCTCSHAIIYKHYARLIVLTVYFVHVFRSQTIEERIQSNLYV